MEAVLERVKAPAPTWIAGSDEADEKPTRGALQPRLLWLVAAAFVGAVAGLTTGTDGAPEAPASQALLSATTSIDVTEVEPSSAPQALPGAVGPAPVATTTTMSTTVQPIDEPVVEDTPAEARRAPARAARARTRRSARAQPAVARTSEPAPVPQAAEPRQQPSRAEVLAALESVRGQVASCLPPQTRAGAVVQVRVNFASSGRATTAHVSGMHAGTPAGSCIARAARLARVAPFGQAPLAVNYPFRL
jgi:hypothetical protein